MYILNIDKRCNPVFETIAYDIVYAIDGSKDLWSNLRIAARYKDKRPGCLRMSLLAACLDWRAALPVTVQVLTMQRFALAPLLALYHPCSMSCSEIASDS